MYLHKDVRFLWFKCWGLNGISEQSEHKGSKHVPSWLITIQLQLGADFTRYSFPVPRILVCLEVNEKRAASGERSLVIVTVFR